MTGAPPLRGRDAERDALRAAVAAARRDGRGRVVVLSGPPGSGKSRLLHEARELAAAAGARVLTVAGDPDGQVLPHGAVLDAVQAGPEPLLDRAVVDALPRGPEQGWWLRQELRARLEQVAVQRPVVVCVDDAQWCGHGTLRLLRTLPAQLSGHAVVWVVAVRSGSPDAAVAATVRALTEAGADRLDLRPLDGGAVALLVADLLGAVPDDGVLAAAARAGGQPLLLVELLRGWLDERLVRVGEGRARLHGDVLPARLRDAVQRRTERLSPAAAEVLQIGAVLGRRFAPDLLAAVLDRPPPAVLAPMQELVAAGLLEDDGDALRFGHDLVREAVAAAIPAALTRVLRRHAVDVLLARGAPAPQVATMLAASAVPGDLEAVAALRTAAASLALTASPAAADFSTRALQLLPGDSPARPDLVSETVRHLWQCGRSAAAAELAARELAGAPGTDRTAEARVRLGLARFTTRYSSTEAIRQCRAALALDGLADGLRSELLLVEAVNHGFAGEPDAADADLALAGTAPGAGAALTRARAETYVAFHRQEWDRAFRRHRDVVRACPVDEEMNPAPLWEATMWTSVGHPARALALADAELATARRDGRVGSLLMWRSLRARALFDAGRLGESRAEGVEVLDAEEIHLVGGLMDLFVVHALVRGALHAARPDVVRAHRDRVGQMTADGTAQVRRNGLWLTALVADAAGDAPAALRAAGEAVAALDRPGPSMSGVPDLADEVVLTRIALRAGDRHTAARAVEAAERRAAANPGWPVGEAAALHARGLLHADEVCLRGAVRALAGTERPLLLASAREDLARTVAADRPAEAVALLDEALAAYAAAGAGRDAARARRSLRGLGARRRRAPDRPEGRSGLTPAEREVVRLVAEGGTNRQVAERLFLSPHTVNTHLRNAFVKLGVRSRLELARRVSSGGV